MATLRSGAFGPHAMDYFEYCLRIMAPSTCGTATKLEAVAMITGAVSLFERTIRSVLRGLLESDA